MRSSANLVRAAILAASVAGCCEPTHQGKVVVPVRKVTLEEQRAAVAQETKESGKSKSTEEAEAALCRRVCGTSGASWAKSCEILPLSTNAAEPYENDGRGAASPVAVDPGSGAASPAAAGSESPPALTQPAEFAAVCDVWQTNMCGRRPVGWQPPAEERGGSEVGRYLAHSARLEADSVDAFVDFATALKRFGAPESLVNRANRAAVQEVGHARAMAREAARHGAKVPPRFEGARPAAPRTAEALSAAALETFATLNGVEGCSREAFGAVIARRCAERAASRRIRSVFRRIAEEELRHAELSWEVQKWALRRLAPSARERVERARRRALAELVRSPPVAAPPVREALGLPDRTAAQTMARALALRLDADLL